MRICNACLVLKTHLSCHIYSLDTIYQGTCCVLLYSRLANTIIIRARYRTHAAVVSLPRFSNVWSVIIVVVARANPMEGILTTTWLCCCCCCCCCCCGDDRGDRARPSCCAATHLAGPSPLPPPPPPPPSPLLLLLRLRLRCCYCAAAAAAAAAAPPPAVRCCLLPLVRFRNTSAASIIGAAFKSTYM